MSHCDICRHGSTAAANVGAKVHHIMIEVTEASEIGWTQHKILTVYWRHQDQRLYMVNAIICT